MLHPASDAAVGILYTALMATPQGVGKGLKVLAFPARHGNCIGCAEDPVQNGWNDYVDAPEKIDLRQNT